MQNEAETSYLPNTRKAPAHLGSLLLLGLGKTGRDMLSYCMPLLGTRIDCLAVLEGSAEAGYTLQMHTPAASEEMHAASFDEFNEVGQSFDLCVASPGIAPHAPVFGYAASHSHELISEVEFAWRESSAESRWIAITGTNGKSTTTALCAHVLQCCGMRASAVGNIGSTCIQAVAEGATDVYVAEVSSYQLASTVRFAPHVAVLLNITPDHLQWHGSFEAYVEAKAKLFANACACRETYAVVDATCKESRAILQQLKSEGRCITIPVGTANGIDGDMRSRCGSENAAFLRGDGMLMAALAQREVELVKADELRIPGMHNVLNALSAAAAALCLGAPAEGVRGALRSFTALEHRIEFCGEVAGAVCYNDSKATNVDATLKALSAFSPKKPIVLLGGDDKGTELDELVTAAQQHCQAVVCFGAAGPRFAQAFEGTSIPCELVGGMEAALDAALAQAGAGSIVLLSPACASFDEFSNFEHRGQVFKELVAARAKAGQA